MAQQYGLGNFLYEITVENDEAQFHFWDPEDASNTADVSVATGDFPDGVTDADSRQVAELAYSQCSKLLNEKRDERRQKEAADDLKARTAAESRSRDAAADLAAHSQELADTTPTGSAPAGQSDKPAQPHNEQSQDSVSDDSEDADKNSKDAKKK